MKPRWSFSGWMLTIYVGLFLVWFVFPSRLVFLVTGGLAISGLSWAMIRARKRNYFVNKVDVRLHALVILDLFLETISFEVFRLFKPLAVVDAFHHNTHFIGCASSFALLIGCYRLFAIRQAAKTNVLAENVPVSS